MSLIWRKPEGLDLIFEQAVVAKILENAHRLIHGCTSFGKVMQ